APRMSSARTVFGTTATGRISIRSRYRNWWHALPADASGNAVCASAQTATGRVDRLIAKHRKRPMDKIITRKVVANEADLNRDPISGTPGAHPLGTVAGAASGGVAGAAAGMAVGGPVGSVIG